MGKQRPEQREQPTIWEIPDEVWPLVQTILDAHDPAKRTGLWRVDLRRVLHGIIFRLRTGGPWPQPPARFGDDRTVHRHVQPWCQGGIVAHLWAMVVETCDALGGVDWPWQAADAAMGNARRGVRGRNPTDRGNKGCNAAGWWKPMADRWARPLLRPTSTIPSAWPPRLRTSWESAPSRPRSGRSISAWTRARTMPPSSPPSMCRICGTYWEEKLDPHGQKTYPVRRWVVERTLAWRSKCRGLLVHDAKNAIYFLGLRQLACALIWMWCRTRLIAD